MGTRQDVHTECAIGLELGIGMGATIHAHQQSGRRVGDAAHRRSGEAETTARAIGGNDRHRAAEQRHRIAKLVDIYHGHSPQISSTSLLDLAREQHTRI
ncbi:hypothetical protein D3C80_1374030 [compost metagenome]